MNIDTLCFIIILHWPPLNKTDFIKHSLIIFIEYNDLLLLVPSVLVRYDNLQSTETISDPSMCLCCLLACHFDSLVF